LVGSTSPRQLLVFVGLAITAGTKSGASKIWSEWQDLNLILIAASLQQR
jgi:hypothetical protein